MTRFQPRKFLLKPPPPTNVRVWCSMRPALLLDGKWRLCRTLGWWLIPSSCQMVMSFWSTARRPAWVYSRCSVLEVYLSDVSRHNRWLVMAMFTIRLANRTLITQVKPVRGLYQYTLNSLICFNQLSGRGSTSLPLPRASGSPQTSHVLRLHGCTIPLQACFQMEVCLCELPHSRSVPSLFNAYCANQWLHSAGSNPNGDVSTKKVRR